MIIFLFVVCYIVGAELIIFWVAPLFGCDFINAAQASGVNEQKVTLVLSLSPIVTAVLGMFVSGRAISSDYQQTGSYDFSPAGFLRNVTMPYLWTHVGVFFGMILIFIGKDTYYALVDPMGRFKATFFLIAIAPLVGAMLSLLLLLFPRSPFRPLD